MFDIVRAESGGRAHRLRKLDPARHRGCAVPRRRASTSTQAKAAAKRRDFRPVDLKATLIAHVKRQDRGHHLVQRRRLCCRGKRCPDETVIYTGHWDHLGIGKPDANGDSIYNGALDNATGIAHIIEQARAFARRPRTERSVVFLAVTAEEKGLLGSEYYAAEPAVPARQDGRHPQHRRRPHQRPGARTSPSPATPSSGCSTCWSPKARSQGRRYQRPIPHPEAG